MRVVTPHSAPENGGQGHREMQEPAQQVAKVKISINDNRTLWAERFQPLGNVVCLQIQATCNTLYEGGQTRATVLEASTYGADGSSVSCV